MQKYAKICRICKKYAQDAKNMHNTQKIFKKNAAGLTNMQQVQS